MSLRDKLEEILPGLLPAREEDAIKGTELISRVRAVLGDTYSDRSLRSQFSFIALEPDSCLARVPNGQGYYLRSDDAPASLQDMFAADLGKASESDTPRHKALALAVRLYDTAGLGVFVYPVDGEAESWEHPDLVAVQWPKGRVEADGAYVLDKTAEGAAAVPAFRAVCVAPLGAAEECRRAFFRTLACGQWAQESELLLLGLSGDVPEELQHLALRYGVGVRTLEADEETLQGLPRADLLFRAAAAEARRLLGSLSQGVIAHAVRGAADAVSVQDMPDIRVVLDWAQACVDRGRIEPYEQRVAVD